MKIPRLKTIKKTTSLSLILASIIAMILSPYPAIASDLDFYSLNDILFYDKDYVNANGSGNNCGGTGPGSINDPGGPYVVEQLVTAILKSLASKKGVAEKDVVTKEHVDAFIAFAITEGGDTHNPGEFNIFNGGIGLLENREDLWKEWPAGERYVAPTAGGISYVSFTSAVEAYTIKMTGEYQSRIGDIVTTPNTDAETVLKRIAENHGDTTDGYHSWAAQSEGDWMAYYNANYKANLDRIRGDEAEYKKEAGAIIGTSDWVPNDTFGPTNDSKLMADRNDPLAGSSSAQSAATQSSAQTGILLDPGHGGGNLQEVTDAETGLASTESSGAPDELSAMWEEANIVKQKLEAAGYRVDMTKNNEDDSASLFDKGRKGNSGGYAMAISLHGDPAQPYPTSGIYGVAPQRVGQYREFNGKRTTFGLQDVANKSLEYATAIANQTGSGVAESAGDFFRADITSKGDIAIVQLISTIPWVYDEKGGAVNSNIKEHAEQIATGIINSVPSTGANWLPGSGGSSCGVEDIVNKALEYAWPNYREKKTADGLARKPEYAAAVAAALKSGKYIGDECRRTINGMDGSDGRWEGDDCGGFVTRVMQDSGADPDYGGNGNTDTQREWLEEKEKEGKYIHVYERNSGPIDTGILQPGDIYIQQIPGAGHTFLYVGKNSYFTNEEVVASASQCNRAPMAGNEVLTDTTYDIYRYVGGK